MCSSADLTCKLGDLFDFKTPLGSGATGTVWAVSAPQWQRKGLESENLCAARGDERNKQMSLTEWTRCSCQLCLDRVRRLLAPTIICSRDGTPVDCAVNQRIVSHQTTAIKFVPKDSMHERHYVYTNRDTNNSSSCSPTILPPQLSPPPSLADFYYKETKKMVRARTELNISIALIDLASELETMYPTDTATNIALSKERNNSSRSGSEPVRGSNLCSFLQYPRYLPLFYSVFQTEQYVCYMMRHYQNGSLREALRQRNTVVRELFSRLSANKSHVHAPNSDMGALMRKGCGATSHPSRFRLETAAYSDDLGESEVNLRSPHQKNVTSSSSYSRAQDTHMGIITPERSNASYHSPEMSNCSFDNPSRFEVEASESLVHSFALKYSSSESSPPRSPAIRYRSSSRDVSEKDPIPAESGQEMLGGGLRLSPRALSENCADRNNAELSSSNAPHDTNKRSKGGKWPYPVPRIDDEDVLKHTAAQILLALQFLHHHGILYRDLKTENILIDERGYVALGDFDNCRILPKGSSDLNVSLGCEREASSKTEPFYDCGRKVECLHGTIPPAERENGDKRKRSTSIVGTVDYLCPEVISDAPVGKAIDSWGFGVLLFELAVGFTPFRTSIGAAPTVHTKRNATQYSPDQKRLFEVLPLDKDKVVVRSIVNYANRNGFDAKEAEEYRNQIKRELREQLQKMNQSGHHEPAQKTFDAAFSAVTYSKLVQNNLMFFAHLKPEPSRGSSRCKRCSAHSAKANFLRALVRRIWNPSSTPPCSDCICQKDISLKPVPYSLLPMTPVRQLLPAQPLEQEDDECNLSDAEENAIVRKACRFEMSPALLDLLDGLLHPNPQKRLTLDQCRQHPWWYYGNELDLSLSKSPSENVAHQPREFSRCVFYNLYRFTEAPLLRYLKLNGPYFRTDCFLKSFEPNPQHRIELSLLQKSTALSPQSGTSPTSTQVNQQSEIKDFLKGERLIVDSNSKHAVPNSSVEAFFRQEMKPRYYSSAANARELSEL